MPKYSEYRGTYIYSVSAVEQVLQTLETQSNVFHGIDRTLEMNHFWSREKSPTRQASSTKVRRFYQHSLSKHRVDCDRNRERILNDRPPVSIVPILGPSCCLNLLVKGFRRYTYVNVAPRPNSSVGFGIRMNPLEPTIGETFSTLSHVYFRLDCAEGAPKNIEAVAQELLPRSPRYGFDRRRHPRQAVPIIGI